MSCTTLLVGKGASYSGATIIARNDDSGSGRYDPKRLIVVHPDDQPRHYKAVISHVEIELPDNPCRYTIAPNVLNNRGVLAEAGVNEHNVAMSATETIAVNERVLAADPLVEYRAAQGEQGQPDYQPEQAGGIGEEDIITLVLPYVTTAREAVMRFGELLEQYGTYEANGVIMSDPSEIWYVETIGGHHWIARRVPDNAYATIPNQLGLDYFDVDAAFGEQREYMCSADLREFMAEHHLDMTMPVQEDESSVIGLVHGNTVVAQDSEKTQHGFNPRHAFGTATHKDHIYNTPRAWFMQRTLNPSHDWDSPSARYTPISDDIPWCRVPERKVSIEDVDFIMSSHFEGTPYDPYGTLGTAESRHRYRPIGINRTGHMVAIELRNDVPVVNAAVMWVSFGSGPFNAVSPLYANVTDTPAYLRDTAAEVSTDSYYWTMRMIAAMADPHYMECSNAVEHYMEDIHAAGHRFVYETDASVRELNESEVSEVLTRANALMGEQLRKRTQELLSEVLYISSNNMRNSFAMSDRWA